MMKVVFVIAALVLVAHCQVPHPAENAQSGHEDTLGIQDSQRDHEDAQKGHENNQSTQDTQRGHEDAPRGQDIQRGHEDSQRAQDAQRGQDVQRGHEDSQRSQDSQRGHEGDHRGQDAQLSHEDTQRDQHDLIGHEDSQKAQDDQRNHENAQSGIEGDRSEHQLPAFPNSLYELKLNFNDLFQNIIEQDEQKGRIQVDSRIVGLIAPVSNVAYEKLIARDRPDPLKDSKNRELAYEFIMDSISEESLNKDDPKLLTAEGVRLRNLLGNELHIRKDSSTGEFNVNGVSAIYRQLKGQDTPFVLVLSDFLPGYRQRISEVIRQSERGARAQANVRSRR